MTLPDTDISIAHVVLRNGDILPEILKFLDPDHYDKIKMKERRRTLSRLARVCKLFKDPALAILWHALQDLTPFLALAPETFRPICHDQVAEDTIWQTIQYYAGFVTDLEYRGISSDNDEKRLAFLSRVSRGKPLFPRLRRLELRFWPLMLCEASLLFSYDLSSFRMPLERDFERRPAAGKISNFQLRQLCIHLLIQRSPTLQIFHDFGYPQNVYKPKRELSPVLNLTCLTHLFIIGAKDPSVNIVMWLERISRMQNLRVLYFEATGFHQAYDAISHTELGDFCNLKELDIYAPIQLISFMFRSLHRNVLTSVSLGIKIDESALTSTELVYYRVRDCIEILVSRTERSLEQIDISLFGPSRPTITPLDTPLITMIQPLTRIRNLQQLFVSLHQEVIIRDEDIVTMAQSWPDIRALRLHPLQKTSDLGVRSLMELATRCPRLEQLALPISFTHIPPLDSVPILDHGLSRLYFQEPKIDDPGHLKQIATLVHQLFPRLDISSVEPYRKEVYPVWWKTMEQVKVLQEAGDPKVGGCVKGVLEGV